MRKKEINEKQIKALLELYNSIPYEIISKQKHDPETHKERGGADQIKTKANSGTI